MLRITLTSHSTICIFTRSHKKMWVSYVTGTPKMSQIGPLIYGISQLPQMSHIHDPTPFCENCLTWLLQDGFTYTVRPQQYLYVYKQENLTLFSIHQFLNQLIQIISITMLRIEPLQCQSNVRIEININTNVQQNICKFKK